MPEPLDPEILQEIEDTKRELGIDTEDKPIEEPKKEEPKPEPKPKDEAPKPEEETPEKPKSEPEKPKDEAVIPLWKVRVMEKKHNEAVEKLNAKINELTNPKKGEPSAAETAKKEDEIEKLSNELTAGLDDEQKTAQKTVIRKIIEAARQGMQLPADVQEALKILPQLQKSHEEQQLEQQFSSEFDAEVRPLVEKEYGQVSAELLARVKADMKQKITSDTRLITSPLSLIYNGSSEFRGLAEIPKPTPSAEPSRGGQARAAEMVDFENMTEDKYLRLSDEDKDRYADYIRAKERNRNN